MLSIRERHGEEKRIFSVLLHDDAVCHSVTHNMIFSFKLCSIKEK